MGNRRLSSTMLAGSLAGTGLFLTLILAGAALAAGDEPARIPCGDVPAAISKAAAADRVGLVVDAVERRCRPLPATVLNALRSGKWADGSVLAGPDRIMLLTRATDAAYPEAETLAVSLIESGAWTGGESLTVDTGAQVIRSLKNVLTTYRTHLLLDVFEQMKEPPVQQAVILALRGSKLDEALLPAVEAAYEASDQVKEAANGSIAEQPEKTAPEVHGRLIRKLPEGPMLNWALRLAAGHPSSAVAAARKARGLPE